MSAAFIGILSIFVLLFLMYTRMWIGLVMLFVGFWGIVAISGLDIGLMTLKLTPYRTMSSYTFAAMPLFLFMGVIVSNTGFATDLFFASYKWIGQFRGGLAMATSIACAVLGVVTDSMVAVITMGKAAIPEMRKYGYGDSLANGSIVAGASLASLMPPSMGFILYALLTNASVGELYIAAIIPSFVLLFFLFLVIHAQARINPSIAPAGPKVKFREKITASKYAWGVGLIFIIILGGIYAGMFTPTEAGAVGAFGAIIIGFIGGRMGKKVLLESILETSQMTAMIALLMVGASIFSKLMTISTLPVMLVGFVEGLHVSRYLILGAVIIIHIILGMFCDILSCIIITIPILYPLITSLGFDPVWFGVIIVIVIEMGLITPPLGMNVFLLAGISHVPIYTIFRGIWPFVVALLLFVIFITIFPQIVLFLPGTMG